MDKKYIAILGAGVIGAGALILLGAPQTTAQPGGAFGGGSKKEGTTVTETPTEPGAPVYNITFPDPGFPAVPQINFAEILQQLGETTTTSSRPGTGGRTKKQYQSYDKKPDEPRPGDVAMTKKHLTTTKWTPGTTARERYTKSQDIIERVEKYGYGGR